jgi:hypothetical protein
MTQYGQGSGIHLAVGSLIDVSGHDTYVMHAGLGQGGSHDYAASILHDRGGNDRYLGNTSCNGCGLANSAGIHIDREGNDVYAGRRRGGVNTGRPARGFGSIGVLLDLQGQDDYLGIMQDEGAWRHTDVGVGFDLPDPESPTAPVPAAPASAEERVEIPPICSYEGELSQEVFDELWTLAIRWEVGDNRLIVPEARKRLAAFGAPVLDLLDAKVEQPAAGLEYRAFVDVLRSIRDLDEEAAVRAFLSRNLAHESARRRTVALHVVGELRFARLGEEVAAQLHAAEEDVARRAAQVLGRIESDAGHETLVAWLAPDGDERRIQAAIGTLVGREAPVFAVLRPLLDHSLMSVRTMLATALGKHASAYEEALGDALRGEGLSTRALRTVLDVHARSTRSPTAEDVVAASAHLASADWGLRADAARLLRKWADQDEAAPEVTGAARRALDELLTTEEDPYVRFNAGAPDYRR